MKKVQSKVDLSMHTRETFMAGVVANAEVTPSSHKYRPNSSQLFPAAPIWAIKKQIHKPKKKKDGKPLLKAEAKHPIMRRARSACIAKAKSRSVLTEPAERTKAFPATGTYTCTEKTFELVSPKSQTVLIYPHKISRFTENVMKKTAWVPGPGTYNLGPPKRKALASNHKPK